MGYKVHNFLISRGKRSFVVNGTGVRRILRCAVCARQLVITCSSRAPVCGGRIRHGVSGDEIRGVTSFLVCSRATAFPAGIILKVPRGVVRSRSLDGRKVVGLIFGSGIMRRIIGTGYKSASTSVCMSVVSNRRQVENVRITVSELHAVVSGDNSSGIRC